MCAPEDEICLGNRGGESNEQNHLIKTKAH